MWWLWLLIGLGSLAGFGLLLLSVPVVLTFSVEQADGPKPKGRITWLFGLVGKDVKGGEKAPQRPESRADKPQEVKRPKKRWVSFAFSFMKSRRLRQNMMKLLWRLLPAIKVRRLDMDVKVGLGDPADTGVLLGLVSPVVCGLASVSRLNLTVEGDFQEATLQGQGAGAIRIVPIRFIPPLLMFILSPSTIWGIKSMLRGGK